ncbi:DUF6286 domain-containing protein [Streptomyces sp. NPDC051662]|uniref:DUF6286 domain-containing protein n=1 Tax=Streptomyces sp. NPDC051662 TaxID=3154750 RepID=UPI0034125791
MSAPAPEGGAGATERGGGVGEWDPPDPTTRDEPRPTLSDDDGRRAGRFWSTRRVPAALTALVVLGAAGLLLYDIAAVRAGRPAMYWRRELAVQLARQPLDNPWVLVAAGVAMALGLWLLALALTPGLRGLLPMRRQSPLVRAGIDRAAAALTLRDRAMEVSGVRSVRVRMGRSKVKVRALSHFRELADVRNDLDRVLTAGIRELGLDRAPALTMRVRRPVKKR